MLLQLHRQKRADLNKTEIVAQCDPNQIPFVSKEWKANTLHEWIKSVQSRHEIADDEVWLLCDEDSPYFVRAAGE
jgi:hypothetical protein